MPLTTGSSSRGRVLLRAILVGTVLQLVLVQLGHRVPAIKSYFAPAAMLISLAAGWLYARWRPSMYWNPRADRATAVIGGPVAGAVCAFLGILESCYLGDVPVRLLALGTGMSAVTGAVGGWFGGRVAGK